MNAQLALPEGKRGQLFAGGLTLAALLVIWAVLLAPLYGWYQSRAETLAGQRALAAHMLALADATPDLRAALAQQSHGGTVALLSGATDAVAAANLQTALQVLAAESGASLQSVAPVGVLPLGNLRKIGLAVSLSADWPQFSSFLDVVETASPRMLVENLSLTATLPADPGGDVQLLANFTVSAFRPAAGE
jgi:general secretion pathway protein M